MSDRIGIATWLMGKRPLAERVTWAAEHGFSAVSFEGAQLVDDHVEALDESVCSVIRDADLAVTTHLSPAALAVPERAAAFERSVERAVELHRLTRRLNCVSIDPAWKSGKVIEYDPEGTLASLARIVDAVGGCDGDVAVAVENWKINPDPDEFRRLVGALDGAGVGMLLDLGHLHVMHEDSVRAAAEVPIPVREIHVSDNNGRSDDHLALGRGTLPIDEIAVVLAAGGFSGVWTLEMRAEYDFSRCCISRPRAQQNILAARERLAGALSAARETLQNLV